MNNCFYCKYNHFSIFMLPCEDCYNKGNYPAFELSVIAKEYRKIEAENKEMKEKLSKISEIVKE